jgi:hypothetical protein
LANQRKLLIYDTWWMPAHPANGRTFAMAQRQLRAITRRPEQAQPRMHITRTLPLLVALGTVACVGINSSTSQGAGNGQDAATASSSTTATGIACNTDLATHATLCAATTACPSVSVDATLFPNCGFRTLQAAFELDCVCYGNYLCPVGTVKTCLEVTTLFSSKTLASVCNEVSLGLCSQSTASTTTGTGGRTSTCNQDCYSSCVGSPACIVACGC